MRGGWNFSLLKLVLSTVIYSKYKSMKIRYIKIRNYRSFGDEALTVENPGGINLFIGTNNAGKSNILKFLSILGHPDFRPMLAVRFGERQRIQYPFALEDFRDFNYSNKITFQIGFEPTESFVSAMRGVITFDDAYVTYELQNTANGYLLKPIDSFLHHISEKEAREYESLRGTTGGPFSDRLESVIRSLNVTEQILFPEVEYLSEFRKITENKQLRERLNSIVNFDHTTQHLSEKKDLLCSYFKEIFGFDIDIKIPSVEREIQLVIDKKYTPLSSLGTGYQEIVLIAFVIITTPARIVCIDEPELHLHPRAQRALLNLISTIEDKRFFLATHSNHFLDYEINNKKIYQITNNGKGSVSTEINNSLEITKLIDDLGIRASEIYQTNGIVWVEGPSDRIYVKKWLELKYPNLKEGLQFTFQFYGGKVLSHYSLNDEEFLQYLNLLVINKNSFIIIDSDKEGSYSIDDLRDTKKRIIAECKTCSMGYWITKGKEIENYLSNRVLFEISGREIKRNIYKSLSSYCSEYDLKKKVPFARKVEKKLTLIDLKENEDLEEKIDILAKEIIKWNGGTKSDKR